MNRKEQIIKFFAYGIPLTIMIWLSFKLPADEKEKILSDPYEVIGEIWHSGVKNLEISYRVNG